MGSAHEEKDTSKPIPPKGKVFRDPIHGLIRIDPEDEFILELVDTPEFQRLRRVRQLGVSSVTYPGAEHSRFTHSLGVYNFCRRILESLSHRYKQEGRVTAYLTEHSRPLKAASLVHDIGHGPFSHMIERAFGGNHDHEAMTVRLITEPTSNVFRILTNHAIEPNDVAEIITKTSEHRLIIDIVSSQLDADRMDYLLRDSLMTGVEYGRYDSEWLLNNLCIGRDPNAEKQLRETDWRLCLDKSRGLHTAEQLIISRMHMNLQVYMHRVTRGYEVLLLNLFKIAAKLAKQGNLPKTTPDSVSQYFMPRGEMSLDQWLRFDESAMLQAFHFWSQSKLKDLARLANAYLDRVKLYKGVSLKGLTVEQHFALAAALGKKFHRGLDWELDDGELLPYKGVVYAASRVKEDPEERSAESILLSSGEIDEIAQAVETVSDILKSLDFKTQHVSRLYYDRALSNKIEPVLKNFGVEMPD